MAEKIRVLLVDDEERFVRNMERILRNRGLEVGIAFDGLSAVETVRSGPAFDVVVLDIRMPGMDGIAALERIKHLAPATEVIMLTGHASISSGIEAMRLGAFDYLVKPCDPEDLLEKVREAFESECVKRHPVLWPRKHVSEIPLHPPVRLGPQEPLRSAFELLSRETGEAAVDEAYVIDAEDRLRGVVARRDLIREVEQAHPSLAITWPTLEEKASLIPDIPISAVMRPAPAEIAPEASLTEAGNRMILHNLRCLPVVRSGRTLGLIKLQDVFRYVEQESE